MAIQKGKSKTKQEKEVFPLAKQNYILMLIGFLIIIVGYILMAGKQNIFGFTKMYLSVIFVLFGFGFIIYGIMKKKPVHTENE